MGFGVLTYAAKLNQIECANYLSIRSKNIDEEGPDGLTIFSKYVLDNNFEMS